MYSSCTFLEKFALQRYCIEGLIKGSSLIEISLVGHLEATILGKLRCVQSQTETFYTQRVNQHVLTYNLLQQVLDIVKSHVQRGKQFYMLLKNSQVLSNKDKILCKRVKRQKY